MPPDPCTLLLYVIDRTFVGPHGNNSFKGLGVEGSDGAVLYGAGNFNGVAADFTIFNIGLTANRKVYDHRNLLATIRTTEKVFHLEIVLVHSALENGLDFGVDRDLSVTETIDLVGGACARSEVKIPADMIVLVKCAEDALDLRAVEGKISKRDGASVAARNGQIFLHHITEIHVRAM
jgi:hypothetical protein